MPGKTLDSKSIVCALMTGFALMAFGGGPATSRADNVTPPVVDPSIQVQEGNRPFLVAHARGTQNYTCNGSGAWGPAVPVADLFDDQGHKIGTHYAGPTWEFRDGSWVRATRIGIQTVSGAIPWLLLQKTSAAAGADGDRFLSVTYIQRVNTTGGLPPEGTCTPGATVSVPYTADYYFYRATSGGE